MNPDYQIDKQEDCHLLRAYNLCSIVDLPLVVEDLTLIEPMEEEREAQTLVTTAMMNSSTNSHSFLGNALLQEQVIRSMHVADFAVGGIDKWMALSKSLFKAIMPI